MRVHARRSESATEGALQHDKEKQACDGMCLGWASRALAHSLAGWLAAAFLRFFLTARGLPFSISEATVVTKQSG